MHGRPDGFTSLPPPLRRHSLLALGIVLSDRAELIVMLMVMLRGVFDRDADSILPPKGSFFFFFFLRILAQPKRIVFLPRNFRRFYDDLPRPRS